MIKYEIIYADPPWYEPGGGRRGANSHYSLMKLEDIIAIGKVIRLVVRDDAFLFLWSTLTSLQDALKVMEAWGFKYVTNMVWVKPRMGIGWYLRSQHELLLIGKRGRPAHSQRPAGTGSVAGRFVPPSIVNAPKSAHSRKPDEFHAIIEHFGDGPKLEIFAREHREGWDAWGDELGITVPILPKYHIELGM